MNFPNYEKLKSFVETFATYNSTLIIEEQLWMSSITKNRAVSGVFPASVSSPAPLDSPVGEGGGGQYFGRRQT